MQGDTIVFYPKYTTLVAKASAGEFYYSDPYEVTGYNQVDIEVHLDADPTGSIFNARIEESSDLETWSPVAGGISPVALGSQQMAATNTLRYIRVVIETTAGGAAAGTPATLWVKGVVRNT